MVAFIYPFGAESAHQIKLHSTEIPFTSEFIVVIIRGLLNGHVRQMHERIGKIVQIVAVPGVSKSAESFSIQINGQWLVANDEYINSKIELFTANQKRVHDIPLDNVRFCLRTLWLPSQLVFPLGNMLKLIEQENTFALTLSNWFHDPNLARSFELFNE